MKPVSVSYTIRDLKAPKKETEFTIFGELDQEALSHAKSIGERNGLIAFQLRELILTSEVVNKLIKGDAGPSKEIEAFEKLEIHATGADQDGNRQEPVPVGRSPEATVSTAPQISSPDSSEDRPKET